MDILGLTWASVSFGKSGGVHDALVWRRTSVHVQVDGQLAFPRRRTLLEPLLSRFTTPSPPPRPRPLLLHQMEEVHLFNPQSLLLLLTNHFLISEQCIVPRCFSSHPNNSHLKSLISKPTVSFQPNHSGQLKLYKPSNKLSDLGYFCFFS